METINTVRVGAAVVRGDIVVVPHKEEVISLL
jgi:hypothetical protein